MFLSDKYGHFIGSEKSTSTMFSYTSLAIARGAFVSAMRFKFSSVTAPRDSDPAKESYPEQKHLRSDFPRAFFQAVQKVLTIQVPLLRASGSARRRARDEIDVFNVVFKDIARFCRNIRVRIKRGPNCLVVIPTFPVPKR